MVKIRQEILRLTETPRKEVLEIDQLAVGNKLLEFISHLSNIGGFCDKDTRRVIYDLERFLAGSVIDPSLWLTASLVNVVVAMTIGIQIDFNSRPFKLIGLGVHLKEIGANLVLRK